MAVLEASGLVNTGNGSALTRVYSRILLHSRNRKWSVMELSYAAGIMRWGV